jgi:hypothetical protein
MSGIHNGLQSSIKKSLCTAEFVPCLAHPLNLVGTFAAKETSVGNQFFMTIKHFFTFFF